MWHRYMMLKFGVLQYISLQIYHDPEHLIHLFEDIHFMLFFVMLTFLFQACILVIATLRAEEFYMRTEKLLGSAPPLEKTSPADAAAAPAVAQMLATYKAARAQCCTRVCICPRMLWGYREAEAKEELVYSLLRMRFVFPAKVEPGAHPLPPEFDFSTYLRHRCCHEVSHTLHVSPNTWGAIILFLGGILYVPVLEEKYAHIDITVEYVVGLGWALWLYCFAIRAKLGHVLYMLTPPHPLLDGPPKVFDAESAEARLLTGKPDAPPFEALSPTKDGSKHERLFWRGRNGPGHLLFLMRLQMLLTAIILAVMYTWLNAKPEDTYFLLLGMLPVLDVMITSPKSILSLIVMTTSVEMFKSKHKHDIHETLTEVRQLLSLDPPNHTSGTPVPSSLLPALLAPCLSSPLRAARSSPTLADEDGEDIEDAQDAPHPPGAGQARPEAAGHGQEGQAGRGQAKEEGHRPSGGGRAAGGLRALRQGQERIDRQGGARAGDEIPRPGPIRLGPRHALCSDGPLGRRLD